VVKSVENSSMTVNRIAPPFPVSDTGQPWPSPIVVNFEVVSTVVDMDLDIAHPATGELADANEESDGGYVALKRNNSTPMTTLKLKTANPSSVGGKYKIQFGSKINVWSDASKISQVSSNSTEFYTSTTTTLYVEGITESSSLRDEEVVLKWVKDGSEKEVDKVKLTIAPIEFEVNITTFIPHNNVESPDIAVVQFISNQNDLFEGDDRNNNMTSSNFDRYGSSFRSRQLIKVYSLKEFDTDGIDSSPSNLIGQTVSYDIDTSLSNGLLSSAAEADNTKNDPLKVDWDTADNSSLVITALTRPSDKIAKVEMKGNPGNPLVSGAPGITWEYTLTFDSTNVLAPTYRIQGDHDGFPSHEVYIEDQRIHEHDPLLTGEGLFSLFPPSEHNVDKNGDLD